MTGTTAHVMRSVRFSPVKPANGTSEPPAIREFDSTFLMLMNAGEGELDFVLPEAGSFVRWELVLDSAQTANQLGSIWAASTAYRLPGRSLSLFRAQPI